MEPLIQLAVALAAQLVAAFPSLSYAGLTLPVTAVWEPEVAVGQEQARLDSPQIWVVDLGEDLMSEKAVSEQEFTLLVVLQMKIAQHHRRDLIVALGSLASQIGRFCRPLDEPKSLVTADVSTVCTRAKRHPARNLEDARKGLFYTEWLTTWKSA